MKIRFFAVFILAGMLASSCAFMKDVDGGRSDKQVQNAIKEVESVADALKAQGGERLFYRQMVNSAEDLSVAGAQLSRVATDSYMRRLANRMTVLADDLNQAAGKSNPETTRRAMEEILATWESLKDYVKPKA